MVKMFSNKVSPGKINHKNILSNGPIQLKKGLLSTANWAKKWLWIQFKSKQILKWRFEF